MLAIYTFWLLNVVCPAWFWSQLIRDGANKRIPRDRKTAALKKSNIEQAALDGMRDNSSLLTGSIVDRSSTPSPSADPSFTDLD